MVNKTISIESYIKTLNGNGSIEFIDALSDNGNLPYMAKFDDVFVIGPLVVHHQSQGGLYAINSLNNSVSADFDKINVGHASDQFINECGPKRDGSYLWLWNMRAYNIWHWTIESLAKVIMAEVSGFDGYYVIPPVVEKSGYIHDSLELLGIDPGRIIPYDGTPWRVERLYLPESINGDYEISKYPKLISMLRNRFLNSCASRSLSMDRIYVARDNPRLKRRIVNESQMLELLFQYGFQRVVMDDYTLKEQIEIAAGANCMVVPHGAGAVHCLFMEEQSLVIELFPTTYVNPCMLPVVDFLKHRYFMIPSDHNSVFENDHYKASLFPIEVTLRREISPVPN